MFFEATQQQMNGLFCICCKNISFIQKGEEGAGETDVGPACVIYKFHLRFVLLFEDPLESNSPAWCRKGLVLS